MSKILPVAKEDLFEIRIHSIGGQGAYMAGQMVAALAADIEGLKTTVFASYGSEKKGAPVSVYIKFKESSFPIKNFSAIKNPNIIVVFHEKLLNDQRILHGLKENGVILVNTDLSAEELKKEYNIKASNIATVNATKIALENEVKINTIIFGSLLTKLSFLNFELGKKQIEAKLTYKYPHLVKKNILAYEQGFLRTIEEKVDIETNFLEKENYNLGYQTQIYGGIIEGVNAMQIDRSISREGYVPLFNQSDCINCTKCDTTCPDDCFIWEEKEGRRGRLEMVLKGINYNHCKGCLRCVEVCPTSALETVLETREFLKENKMDEEIK